MIKIIRWKKFPIRSVKARIIVFFFRRGPKNLPPSCRCQPWHTRSTVCECVHKVRGLEGGCVIGRGISWGREKGSGSLITRLFTTWLQYERAVKRYRYTKRGHASQLRENSCTRLELFPFRSPFFFFFFYFPGKQNNFLIQTLVRSGKLNEIYKIISSNKRERKKRRRIIHVKSFLRKNPVINSEPSNGTLYNVQIKFYFAIKV